ncbi:unnamed protein product [Caenorhabditis brenneri]
MLFSNTKYNEHDFLSFRQIPIPTITIVLCTVTVFFVLTLSNNGIGGYSGFLSLLIALYPAIDPLPNFFVIIPYRKALIGCIQRKSNTIVEFSVPQNSLNPNRI